MARIPYFGKRGKRKHNKFGFRISVGGLSVRNADIRVRVEIYTDDDTLLTVDFKNYSTGGRCEENRGRSVTLNLRGQSAVTGQPFLVTPLRPLNPQRDFSMAEKAEVLGANRLVHEQLLLRGRVRIVAADAGEFPAGLGRVCLASNRVIVAC